VNELAHVFLPVSSVTTFDVANELSGPPSAVRVGKFERPQRRCDLFEVGSASDNLVDEVLHADDTVFAQQLLNDGVVGDGDSLTVDLGVTPLVDELPDSLEVDLAECNVRLNEVEHLGGSLGYSDKDTVVDLEETEELEDFLGFRGDFGDTLQSDDKVHLGLSRDVKVTSLSCLSLKSDLLLLRGKVLLDVLVGPLEDDLAFLLGIRLGLGSRLKLSLPASFVGSSLLEQRLGDGDLLG